MSHFTLRHGHLLYISQGTSYPCDDLNFRRRQLNGFDTIICPVPGVFTGKMIRPDALKQLLDLISVSGTHDELRDKLAENIHLLV